MAEPGCGTCPPGEICRPCNFGQANVKVYLQTVCWDTNRTTGLDTPDRPFTGVTVTASGSGGPMVKTTDGTGLAVFDRLIADTSYSFTVTKTGFDDISEDSSKFPPVYPADIQPKVRSSLLAHKGPAEDIVRVMRRQGLECTRKHAKQPAGTGGGETLGPMFWAHEPWILVLRDVLFLVAVAATIIAFIIGVVAAHPFTAMSGGPEHSPTLAPGAAAVAGICLAFVAYLGMVIFGMGFGIPALIVAFLYFAALMVAMILSLVGASFLPLPPPDPFAFPLLAGTWAGFLWGFVPGRRETYNHEVLTHPIISAILSLVTTIALMIVFVLAAHVRFYADDTDNAVAWVFVVLGMVVGALLLGGVAGLLGFTFVNDGRTHMDWKITDFALPYAGERYCVQSHRGFISHYFKRKQWPSGGDYNQDEEPSYDWSIPEGEPILCGKEGHLVSYIETESGNVRTNNNSDANYVAIRHVDKTVAKYLHLKESGVTGEGFNVGLDAIITTHPKEYDVSADHDDPNPLHVHVGQVIAANGDTGISMFPHLHLFIKMKPLRDPASGTGPLYPAPLGAGGATDPAPDAQYVAFKFGDGDVQSHDGQCWSMRKYSSSNTNRGLLTIVPNNAPFRPTGTPTDGTKDPDSGPMPTQSAGGPSLPSPPTPPMPPGASAGNPPPGAGSSPPSPDGAPTPPPSATV